jgi:hypothetical protein
MKRAWKIMGRGARVLVVGCLGAIFFLFVGLPSAYQWWEGHKLISALMDARSVAVVEFMPQFESRPDSHQLVEKPDLELRRIVLAPAQIFELSRATSSFLNVSFSMSATLCYNPHHRIEIIRGDGSKFSLDICFECEKYQYAGDGMVHNLPPAWEAALRDFFTQVGMPPHTEAEYGQLAAAKTPKAATAN